MWHLNLRSIDASASALSTGNFAGVLLSDFLASDAILERKLTQATTYGAGLLLAHLYGRVSQILQKPRKPLH